MGGYFERVVDEGQLKEMGIKSMADIEGTIDLDKLVGRTISMFGGERRGIVITKDERVIQLECDNTTDWVTGKRVLNEDQASPFKAIFKARINK